MAGMGEFGHGERRTAKLAVQGGQGWARRAKAYNP